MLRTCAREDQSGVLPSGEWREETPLKMAAETPRAGTTKQIRCREDTAGEGGERKNSTGHRSHAKASPGIVERKRPIPKKRGRIPTAASRPTIHDKLNARRYSGTWQNGRGIGFQPSKVVERDGYQDARERRARTQKPQLPQGAQKGWAEVVRSGQVASWDPCKGKTGATVTNHD